MHARTRSVIRHIRDISFAVPLVVAGLALIWVIVLKQSRLPMSASDGGRPYGVIEQPTLFTPGTVISSFTAQYVPSRVIWWDFRMFAIPLLVPEAVQVTIRYQRPGESIKTWEHTYQWACYADETRRCLPLYELLAVQVCGNGINADGHGGSCGYVYLRNQLMPTLHAPACS